MAAEIRTLVAGNWKMNGLLSEGVERARAVAEHMAGTGNEAPEVLLCPPSTLLHPIADAVEGSQVALGGQDCHEEESGAFTGSISAPMLADARCRYAIVGHSERRHGLDETSAVVRAKAQAALEAGLVPIICIGETLEQREDGTALEAVGQQLTESLPRAEADKLVIAYEPVWAIGTGRVAEAKDIEPIHGFIRARLVERLDGGERTRILYGGSVKPDNAKEIMGIPEVNGVLVGGASLDAAEFGAIIDAAG